MVSVREKGPSAGEALLKPLMKSGKIVRKYEGLDAVRARVRRGLKELSDSQPGISRE